MKLPQLSKKQLADLIVIFPLYFCFNLRSGFLGDFGRSGSKLFHSGVGFIKLFLQAFRFCFCFFRFSLRFIPLLFDLINGI